MGVGPVMGKGREGKELRGGKGVTQTDCHRWIPKCHILLWNYMVDNFCSANAVYLNIITVACRHEQLGRKTGAQLYLFHLQADCVSTIVWAHFGSETTVCLLLNYCLSVDDVHSVTKSVTWCDVMCCIVARRQQTTIVWRTRGKIIRTRTCVLCTVPQLYSIICTLVWAVLLVN